MKNVFKVLGIIALVAVIGFSMASCGGDDGGNNDGGNNNNGSNNGGTPNWNGEYQTYGTTNKTKVDFAAKTITGVYDSKDGTWNGSTVISNVTVGSTTDFPPTSGNITHSGKWAYVNVGSEKIGVIYTWVMSMSGHKETDYKLLIGSTNKNDMSLWTPSDGSKPNAAVDLSDVVSKGYYIDTRKEEK